MVDLHTHSTVSDGSDPPARIPELAAAAGCSAVALTDHDRLDGLAEARARAEALGVELVPGCEVSCEWAPGTLHVLVYFVEPGEGPLQAEQARGSGGVAVLAHPLSLQLGERELDSTVAELADAGLSGLEALYGRYSPDERAGLADIAHRHGLVATGGSDYHGTYKPDLTV